MSFLVASYSSGFSVFLRAIAGVMWIIWPYVCLQFVLRITIFFSSFPALLKSSIWHSFPMTLFSMIAGLLSDVIFASHIAIILFLLVTFLPQQLRNSIFGKIISHFFIFIVSCVMMFLFWAEIIIWFKEGVRLSDHLSYYINEALHLFGELGSGKWYGLYLKTLLIILFLIGPSIGIIRIIAKNNLNNDDGCMIFFTHKDLPLMLFCAFGLLFFDLYRSRINFTKSFNSGNVSRFDNRFIVDIAKNGIYDTLTNRLTGMWSFDDLYISIKKSKANIQDTLIRRLLTQKNVFFLDEDSSLSTKTRVVAPYKDNRFRRRNVIVISMDGASGDNVKINGSGGIDIRSMPRFSETVRSSTVFANAYATSRNSAESLFSMLFSLIPVRYDDFLKGKNRLFSLPNILEGYGYDVKFFHENLLNQEADIAVAKRSGLNEFSFAKILKHVDSKDFVENNDLKKTKSKRDLGVKYLMEFADKQEEKMENFLYFISLPSLFGVGNKNKSTRADLNIGYFLSESKKHSWYKDTIFVFLGSKANKMKSLYPVDVKSHRILWVIFDPQVSNKANSDNKNMIVLDSISHLNFAPTMLDLLGLGYISKFHGTSLIRSLDDQKDSNFILLKNGAFFSYVRQDKMIIIEPYKNFGIYLDSSTDSRLKIHSVDGLNLNTKDHWEPMNFSSYSKGFINELISLLAVNDETVDLVMGSCFSCGYTNLLYDRKSVTWSIGRPYHRHLDQEMALQKQSFIAKNEMKMFFLESVAILKDNQVSPAEINEIQYNVLDGFEL